MSEEGQRYISYLLRLWQTESDEGLVWRASLESPQSGERQGFVSLAELHAFLDQEVRDSERQMTHPANGDEC